MPTTPSNSDKRVKNRIPVKIPVMVRLENDGGYVGRNRQSQTSKLEAVALDLSMSGMQIQLEKPLELGYVSQFELHLGEGAQPVTVFAKVVRSTPQGCGLQFLILQEKTRAALEAYLKKIPSRTAVSQGVPS